MAVSEQTLSEYRAFTRGPVSPEVAARVAAMLDDPASELRQWLRDREAYRRSRKQGRRAAMLDELAAPPAEPSPAAESPPGEPPAEPSDVVAEPARLAGLDRQRRRWKRLALTAGVLIIFGAMSGAGYAFQQSVWKSERSERVLALVGSARDNLKAFNRDEALRIFGEADAVASRPVSVDARVALDGLRADMELLRSLSNRYVTSNREWLDHAGIRAASDEYLSLFTDAGLLGGGRSVQEHADAIRARPAVAGYVIAAIDHWLSVLYLLPPPKGDVEAAERRRLDALVRELQQLALAADTAEPSRTVRRLVADGDLAGLEAFFTANTTKGLHPETVGQVTGFLLSRGRARTAFDTAKDAWWSHPNNSTINGVLEKLYAAGVPPGGPDPQESLHFSTLRLASDPLNGVFWANLSIAYRGVGNAAAADRALSRAFELKPKLPLPKP